MNIPRIQPISSKTHPDRHHEMKNTSISLILFKNSIQSDGIYILNN
ncbi:hypothetical protein GCM10010917_08360 [Paenibacillus physcomitrellae]|uniref:Uncharacterized protein n=1 Tax=Paenibacillus physcomitrellae TaxID=1619311 RepID=A0ABQ1FR22_9BACL|nr:hypothetical protein GCM10010917_08360 [Paenibacillus physcomitrellae]